MSDNHFAGAFLDRRAEARLEVDWLVQAHDDPGTRFLVMREGATLVATAGGGGSASVVLLDATDPRIAQPLDPERTVLLGWYQGHRCLLLDVAADVALETGREHLAELRPLASELPADEAALVAYARAMNLWRLNHRHCSRCGTATVAIRAGHARRCPACEHTSFPRLDPAVIVLVHDGERALLGRQASWPPGRYSTIAGFVEPGESLEDAVRREVGEETGIATQQVTYHSSQPWPFPSSLMLGFVARAVHAKPTLRDGELEDARWFDRDTLRSGSVLLPPRHAISRRLIEDWLASADPEG